VQSLGRIIVQLKERGFTIVLVEQNFRFAAPLADRHYIVERGRIAQQLAAAELQSKTEILREYLGV
jgi:branched-chain amino acid transport system ATP-binding protein